MVTHLRGKIALLLTATTLAFVTAPSVIAASAEAEAFGPGATVVLTDAQRAKIMRAIVQQDHGANTPGGKERVLSEPSKPAAATHSLPAPAASELSVGAAVPATVPLTPVPDSVAVEVPSVRRLSYALIGGRLFLVDPTTSMVMSEINQ
jgi:hypothetical protein